MAAAYLIIADTVLYCCGRRDHPIGDGRSDGHSEAQRHSEANSSEPVLTLSPVWEKQVFWETIFPCFGKRGKKRVKSQNGLCPIGRADYPKHSLTAGQKPVYSARIQSFHLAVAHLRCFDSRCTRPDDSIKFNWWGRDNDFIKGVRRVPPYTDLFWAMFYKIAPFLGGIKKLILDAKTAEDVEDIRR